MNDRVRIADLATSAVVDKDCYIIVERPGYGEGTYKATVGDIQEVTAVRAKVTQEGKLTTIWIKDMTGEYEASILTPTAKIVDNGDNTSTITIIDTDGTTECTVVNLIILDPHPIEGSNNLVSSGTVWNIQQDVATEHTRIDNVQSDLDDTKQQLTSEMEDIKQQLTEFVEIANRRLEGIDEIIARVLVAERDQELPQPFSAGQGLTFSSLRLAILASQETTGVVKLFGNGSTEGVDVPEGVDFVLDLNGYELTVHSPGVDPGTGRPVGLNLPKDANIVFKNGIINFVSTITDPDGTEIPVAPRDIFDVCIMNCSNLTLDNVRITTDSGIERILFNRCGTTILKNHTVLGVYPAGTAFTEVYGVLPEYDSPGVFTIVADNTVEIIGRVQFGKADRAASVDFKNNAAITTPIDFDLYVNPLTIPCGWVDNGDGTKTFRYSGE